MRSDRLFSGVLKRSVSLAVVAAIGLSAPTMAAPIVGTNGGNGTDGSSITVGVGGDGAGNSGSGGTAMTSSAPAGAGSAGTAGNGGGGGGGGRDYIPVSPYYAANGGAGGSGEFGTGGLAGIITRAAGGGGDEAGGGGGFGASADTSAGGGGGGGGGRGITISTTDGVIVVTDPVIGGVGGNGGKADGRAYADGGGGGGGGIGVVFSGSGLLTVDGDITGGKGGTGGAGSPIAFGVNTGSYGGSGGTGGSGVRLTGGGTILVNAAILGGDGGARGAGVQVPTKAINGAGGVGIVGGDMHVVLGATGSVSGGLGGDGTTRANAVTFTSGTNSLELLADTATLTGVVAGNGSSDTLRLGGATAGNSFDLAMLGAQFTGFEAFEKAGGGTWSLTGTSSVSTAWTVEDGTLSLPGTLTGTVSTTSSGTFSLEDGVLTGDLDNSGTTFAQGTITGAVTNQASGAFNLTGDLSAGALITNFGLLTAFGSGTPGSFAVSGGAGVTNAGRISLSQPSGIAGDVLDLRSAGLFTAEPGSELYVDIDLSSVAAIASDQMLLGATAGSLQVNFNPELSNYGAFTTGIRVLQTADGNLQATATGLRDRGLVDYDFRQIGTDWYVTSRLNAAPLGGIVAGMATAQSIAGLAALPTGFATSCATGLSSSVSGGTERTTSLTSAGTGDFARSDVAVGYGSTRFNLDFGCLDLGERDATIRLGLVGSHTAGHSAQNEALAGGTALLSTTDFESLYAGIYGQVTAGAVTANAQVGFSDTAYALNADVVGGTGRLIDDQHTNARRLAATGSLAYAVPFEAFNVSPTTGVQLSLTDTDAIQLVDLGGHLDFADRTSLTTFAGLEISASQSLPDSGGSIRYFASGMVYADIGGAQAFTYGDALNEPVALETATAGSRGVVSAGMSYASSRTPAGAGGLLSLRGDVGYAGGAVSTGVTVSAGAAF